MGSGTSVSINNEFDFKGMFVERPAKNGASFN